MLQAEADAEELMARAQRGDGSAFDQLVMRYWDAACRRAARILKTRVDAMDAAQEAFFRLYKNRHSYRTGMSFEAWFLEIVKNSALDQHQRRATRREHHGASDAAELVDPVSHANPGPDEAFAMKEILMVIEEKWARLSPSERELIELVIDGRAVTQIASEMGRHPTTIAERIGRIRRKLRGDGNDNE